MDDQTSDCGGTALLLVTSARVVLGDQARLRPLWEVPLERIARVEKRSGYVILWTWERVGLGTPSTLVNVVLERKIFCSDSVVLEAMFNRLWMVAMQLVDRGSGDQRAFPLMPPSHAAAGTVVKPRGRMIV